MRLRILATTDLHMQFMPYDYLSDRPATGRGLVQAASTLRRLKNAFLADPSNAVLLVDNGDAFQGSLVSDMVACRHRGTHPMVEAMNILGYDAATPGNHDFTFGLDFLDEVSRAARFPLVCSNITQKRGAQSGRMAPLFPPWVIVRRTVTGPDGADIHLRIGIIGFAPPQTTRWESVSVGPDLQGREIVATARDLVPELRRAGADIVVALAHSGIATGPRGDPTENAAVPLASVDGIDAIVAGHIHKVFPGPFWDGLAAADPVAGSICGTPVVMPGAYGSHVGRIDLDLIREAGAWRVRAFDCAAEPVDHGGPAMPECQATPLGRVVQATHAATLCFIRRRVGTTPWPIHSFFGLAAPCSALSVTARALRWYARDHVRLAGSDLPVLAAVSPFRSGGFEGADGYVDIAPGPLLLRHMAELYPFPNDLCLLELDGGQLIRWIERSARLFATIRPGRRDQPLLDPEIPPYQFDVIHGLTYEIDPTRPEGRVRDLRLEDGSPIGARDRVALLTNSFRASGGGGFDEACAAHAVTHETIPLRQILESYVGSGEFDASAQQVWRFAPIPDTSAWFLSGRNAAAHVTDIKGRSIHHDGPAIDGYQRFRINF